ncbi:MAG: twin-arginine translocase TatA/TatE family subunit [Elusimicrobiota bacterium]
MMGLGTTEIVVIAAVLVVLFGAKRIPELAKSLGLSVNAFKNGLKFEAKDEAGPKETPRLEDKAL